MKKLISFIVVLSLLTGCASHSKNYFVDNSYLRERYGSDLSKRDINEIVIGLEIHRRILATYSTYEDSTANLYVEDISGQIGMISKRSHIPYHCVILNSDKIYATGAPGGNVYITTGFIKLLENEAELAGVIAHEIAHLQYRNPKYSNTKKALESMEVAVGVAGTFFGGIGMLAFLGVATVNYFYDEKNIEKRIEMADKKTIEYMLKSGYDPQGFMDVLYKIVYAQESQMPFMLDYYESRPVSVERMEKLDKVFQKLNFQNTSFDTHRERFLTMTKGIRQLYLEK